MSALELRPRNSTYLFLSVVVAQLVLISAQVTTKTGAPILQAIAFGIVSEVQLAGSAVVRAAVGFWTGYVDLRGLRDENERLRGELGQARIALQ